jgi:hypothetical protein
MAEIKKFEFIKVLIPGEVASDEELCIIGKVTEVDWESDVCTVFNDKYCENSVEIPQEEALKVLLFAKEVESKVYFKLNEIEDEIMLPFCHSDQTLEINTELQFLPRYFPQSDSYWDDIIVDDEEVFTEEKFLSIWKQFL